MRRSLAAQAIPGSAARRQTTDAKDDDNAIDPDDADTVVEPMRPFFTAPLAAPDAEWREVSVEQLIDFFRNPSRYLLRKRMAITLPRAEDELEDDEPFLPDVPGRSALADRLLPVLLAGQDHDTAAIHRLAAAGTELPDGALGAVVLDRELETLQRFALEVRQATAAPVLPPHQATVEVEMAGETWRVQAGFADLRAHGLVRWRYDQERARDLLGAWITHLVLCADPPSGVEPVTQWLSLDPPRRFEPRADAREQLAALVWLYRRGLCEPLPFFPKAAWSYVVNGESTFSAQRVWNVTRNTSFAEGADPAYQLAFRGVADPLADTDFYQLAADIFMPMLGEEGAAP